MPTQSPPTRHPVRIHAGDGQLSGAQHLIAALCDAGISTIFSLSGNQIMPLYDACLDFGVRIVHTRHEGAAVYMAEAWAQLTGQTGIALVTAAPGFANALGASYSARMSNTPVLLLSGDSPQSLDGAGAFQEFQQTQAAIPFVKTTERVISAELIRQTIHRAIENANQGVPGPVHLALPADVLSEQNVLSKADVLNGVDLTATSSNLPSSTAEEFLKFLGQAERPIILTGPQFNQTRLNQTNHGSQINALATALNIPVVCIESPRGLNDPSLGSLSQALKQADAVVYFGKDINFQTQYADDTVMPDAAVAVIHPTESQIDLARRTLADRLSFSICTSIDVFCTNALEQVTQSTGTSDSLSAASNEIKQSRTNWHAFVDKAVSNRLLNEQSLQPLELAAGNSLHAANIAKTVNAALATRRNSVLVCDGGEFGQWSQGFATSDKRIINGASGAIGGSIAYAVAASLAEPDALVIAMLGDGTAGFYLAEFETAVREGTNPIIIIGNDSLWNAEHVIQQREYGVDRTYACELSKDINYADCAIALGTEGLSANTPESFEKALNRAIEIATNEHRPVCINALMVGTPAPVYQTMADF